MRLWAQRQPWVLAAGLVILHAYSLFLPYVNQETAFNLGSQYFKDGDPAKLSRYFELEANTLVLSSLGYSVAELLRANIETGCRLVSLFTLFAAVFSFASILRQKESIGGSVIVTSCVFLNPLVWTYAGRGTADFPPMALALVSIALFWKPRRATATTLFAIAIFALAAVVKYHALLLLPFIFLNPNAAGPRSRLIDMIAAGMAAAGAIAVYNVIIFRNSGFWITPPRFALAHAFSPAEWFSNLIRYGGYLAVLTAPFAIGSSMRLAIRPAALVAMVILAAAAGAALPASTGEMNFGPFDRWMGSWASGSLLSAFFLIFGFSVYERWRAGGIDRSLVLAVVPALIVLSASRPAQRYLLLVLPFYCLTLLRAEGIRKYAMAAIAVFAGLNVAVSVLQFKGKPAEVNESFGMNRQF